MFSWELYNNNNNNNNIYSAILLSGFVVVVIVLFLIVILILVLFNFVFAYDAVIPRINVKEMIDALITTRRRVETDKRTKATFARIR